MKIGFIAWMVLLTVFSVLPYTNSADQTLTSYKLTSSGFFIHLFSFFIASFICSKVFKQGSLNIILTSGVVIFLYSILLELIQVFLPYRTFNYYDILANFFGIALWTIIFVIYTKSTAKQLV